METKVAIPAPAADLRVARQAEKKGNGPYLGVTVLLYAAKSMRRDWVTMKMWGGGGCFLH